MLNPASARLYAARWAVLSREEKSASSLALSRALLHHLPLWLPRLVLSVFCALLCPHLEAREITDGNVNYSFVVTDRRTGKKLFLKQAEAFLKWQPQLALERDRMRREVQHFRDVSLTLTLTLALTLILTLTLAPAPARSPTPTLTLTPTRCSTSATWRRRWASRTRCAPCRALRSPLYLAHISPISRLHLSTSRLHLPYISQARFLPRIHHFDRANTTVIMEYLDGHEVAFDP